MKLMLFKDPLMQREFAFLHHNLYRVVEFMAMAAWILYGDILVCTSIARKDSSTHSNPPPYRFIDFAILVNGGLAGTEKIRTLTNEAFEYDSARPDMETVPPLDHGTAPHIHAQVRA